jgi:branched-chain amino acid transport system ATP-binding protein
MALILNTCDRIVALDFGRKIADATPREIQTDQIVIAAYLGEPIAVEPPARPAAVEMGSP